MTQLLRQSQDLFYCKTSFMVAKYHVDVIHFKIIKLRFILFFLNYQTQLCIVVEKKKIK